MINEFQEKISKLRQIYTQPHDQRSITEMERKIRATLQKKELLKVDGIKQIIKAAEEEVSNINFLLAYDEKANAATEDAAAYRKSLFRERAVHLFWLNRFGVKSEEVLKRAIEYMDKKIGEDDE